MSSDAEEVAGLTYPGDRAIEWANRGSSTAAPVIPRRSQQQHSQTAVGEGPVPRRVQESSGRRGGWRLFFLRRRAQLAAKALSCYGIEEIFRMTLARMPWKFSV